MTDLRSDKISFNFFISVRERERERERERDWERVREKKREIPWGRVGGSTEHWSRGRAICNLQFAICDFRFAICNLRFAICDEGRATTTTTSELRRRDHGLLGLVCWGLVLVYVLGIFFLLYIYIYIYINTSVFGLLEFVFLLLCVRDRAPGPFYDVGPNPREWVESCYCLSKWRFD